MIIAAVVLALTAVILAVVIAVLGRSWQPRPRDVAWLAGAGVVPADEAAVISRYLGRHRRHRVVGGFLGVVVAGVAEVRVHDQASLPVLMLGGITGVLVGALSAESYRLVVRTASPTTAVASLEPRDPAPLTGVVATARTLLAASALGAGAVALWAGDALPLWFVAGGLLVTALAEVTRWRIVGRRRPVLSFRARELDARLRAFAGRSVAWLQLATSLLVAGGVIALVPSAGAPGPVRGVLDASRLVVLLLAFVWAIVALHRAAPRPPYSWRRPT